MPSDRAPRTDFPLDRREINRERWRIALRSPLTWLPLLAVVALGWWLKFALTTTLAALALLAIALLFFWRSQTRFLEKRVAGRLISESNQQQDRAISEQMAELAQSGREGYAITLGKFLQLKQAIEAELHGDGDVDPSEENVESLVDALCAGVGEQLSAIARIERRQAAISRSDDEHQQLEDSRRELLGQVIDSYKTLKRTRKELPYIVDPTKAGEALQKPARDLGELADKLRAEEEIARRTRERMARDAVEL